MMQKVRFPKFDANITEGMVGVWYKSEGEDVGSGDPLVQIVTDKATFDFESTWSGTLRQVVAKEKSHVPVGYVIALIGDDADEMPDVSIENEQIMAAHEKETLEVKAKSDGKRSRRRAGRTRVRAVPAARRLAREAGIDIADVPCAADNPVIGEDDVTRYLKSTSDKGEGA